MEEGYVSGWINARLRGEGIKGEFMRWVGEWMEGKEYFGRSMEEKE